jgi:hypothetical protein
VSCGRRDACDALDCDLADAFCHWYVALRPKTAASPFSVWPIARIQRLPKRVGLSCCYMLLHCYTAVRCEGIMSLEEGNQRRWIRSYAHFDRPVHSRAVFCASEL